MFSLSNSKELVEVCRPINQEEAEIVRLLLGSNGIHYVFKSEPKTTIMVSKSVAEKAKKIIKSKGLCLSG